MIKTPFLAALAAVTLCATPVSSQSAEAFVSAFSGTWYSFDAVRAAAKDPCRIELTDTVDGLGAGYGATSVGCAAPLSGLARWTIEDGQLHFMAKSGTRIARLGGSQLRVTGELEDEGGALILDRAGGTAESAALSAALSRHRCIYEGYSPDCADKDALAQPQFTGEEGAHATVGVLVRLNVRSQPRGDASTLGVLDPGTCLRVNYCATASDGVWCRARFGEQSGWVRKTALRQSEWPVLTFANGCTDDEAS